MVKKHRTWICTVLFLDIVSYTKFSVENQMAVREHFYNLVQEALENYSEEDYITLDAGDGMAICYIGDPEDVLLMAISLRDAFQKNCDTSDLPYFVRLGINLGPVKIVELQGERRVIGDAINVASRVMDFAGSNQLLVSRSYYDVVSHVSREYLSMFHYLGLREDKHIRKHAVYEVLAAGEGDNEEISREEIEPTNIVTPAASFDEDTLTYIENELAAHIGPLARILVKKAASKAANLKDLYEALAEDVPDMDGRQAFMRSSQTLH
ncbi:MAG: hypothetical protein BMS9Abin26_0784 [Gammaproteobacteria bacterium]|nr:MAG: hypothetical protein BMS9Abin26_0784 [Gammaproteobacteria bacterium]